ncbi:uncharacterized protein DUF2505 [Halopolyspora algeriensis]|uniref:Uncharacterized protein DUF2505 n=1 Tax=Halopolyspora algeriensis TaxID=1500506 RepID=A0A368VY85_9ACTN|nr:DUF2505 domain-containing protein [Halopolyspora algeriensis]RCW46921.1 uncharacterized protein DUF2505 [Halopolyspora algeriensis]TQM48012.1 uncharacterized protein DUF2505 [Halopolyspora algeriensis]
MARRIEHRSTSVWPASRVHDALIDIDHLEERLSEFSGENTEVVDHSTTEGGVRFQVRQGVPADRLPPMVRTVLGKNLTIDRSEAWRPAEPGHYTGEVAAAIPRVPGSITGSMWLRDLPESERPADGSAVSEFVVCGSVTSNVPFAGSKLEELVADRISSLLAEEMRFISHWLSRQH